MLNTKPRLMTSAILAAALGLGLASGGSALASGQGHHHHGDRIEKMAEKLGLSDAQRSSVEAIFEQNKPTLKSLRERSRANRKSVRELDPTDPQFSSLAQSLADEAATLARERVLSRTQVKAELATVLTPEQMASMQELRGRKGRPGPRGHHKRHGHSPDQVPRT